MYVDLLLISYVIKSLTSFPLFMYSCSFFKRGLVKNNSIGVYVAFCFHCVCDSNPEQLFFGSFDESHT